MAVLVLPAIVPAAARTVVLRLGRIELVQKGKSLHQQLRVVGQRVAAQRCHILCQPSCYHQSGRTAQLFLNALHHAVNEHSRAHHGAGQHAFFGVGANGTFGRAKMHLRELGTAVQGMVDRMRQLTEDMVREHEQKQKSELNALQAQINPHFLYNTLDIIVWMIENGQREDAVRVVTALARFFRISLSKGRNIIPVKDELEHVRNYLLIQEMRYKNKFRYRIDCPAEAENLSTIKLVVQPIVENAIYHSMDFMDGDGLIEIRAGVSDGALSITVADNGLGMTQDVVESLLTTGPESNRRDSTKKGSGIGLKNVQERIRLYFGPQYGVSIQSEPDEGTTVTLHLPAVPYGEMEDT